MRNWTPEARAQQAAVTRRDKPWLKSTGPKTIAGKEKSKHNALKHGLDGALGLELRRLLRLQREFLRGLEDD